MSKNLLKTVGKVFTSGELIARFDANGDGKVTWDEIKTAPLSVWIDILVKYGMAIYIYQTSIA